MEHQDDEVIRSRQEQVDPEVLLAAQHLPPNTGRERQGDMRDSRGQGDTGHETRDGPDERQLVLLLSLRRDQGLWRQRDHTDVL